MGRVATCGPARRTTGPRNGFHGTCGSVTYEDIVGYADQEWRISRAQDGPAPQTRARATAVAGTIRTDGAAVAATLLVDAGSREEPPVPA